MSAFSAILCKMTIKKKTCQHTYYPLFCAKKTSKCLQFNRQSN
jgi:hypothetical protein